MKTAKGGNVKFIWFLFFSLSYAIPSFGQRAFSFSVKGYAQGELGCKGASDEILKRFTQATDVKVLGTECKVAFFGRGLDITVRYVSEAALPLVTNDSWPLTRTYESCLAKLAEEEAFFIKTTGLKPFLRYCAYHSEKTSWEKSFISLFTPVIHAVGKPTALIRSLSFPMYQGGYFGGRATEKEIVKKSAALKIPIVEARIDAPSNTRNYSSDLWLRLVIPPEKANRNYKNEYLLSDRLELLFTLSNESDADPMRADSLEKCESQRKEARSLIPPGSIVWFCMWDHLLFRSQLYNLRVKPGFYRYDKIVPGDDGEPFLNRYGSHEDCVRDRETIVAHYKNKLGEKVTGALCSWKNRFGSETPVRMFIYTKEHE